MHFDTVKVLSRTLSITPTSGFPLLLSVDPSRALYSLCSESHMSQQPHTLQPRLYSRSHTHSHLTQRNSALGGTLTSSQPPKLQSRCEPKSCQDNPSSLLHRSDTYLQSTPNLKICEASGMITQPTMNGETECCQDNP